MVLVVASGCNSAARNAAQQGHILSAGYVKSMIAGKTTPTQDQTHILSMNREWQAMDAAENGTAAEQATEQLVNPAIK